jgi:hypothetical protein
MGGFMGIGGSSAKTDRGQTLGDYGKLNNVFNLGLGYGTQQEQAGQGMVQNAQSTLQPAEAYYRSLLTAGRTQTAEQAAPAIQGALAQSDAAKREAAATGTSRSGGAAEANAEAGSKTGATIDSIINENLMGGKKAGAEGLMGVAKDKAVMGNMTLANAMQMLGLGAGASEDTLAASIGSRMDSAKLAAAQGQAYGELAGMAMLFALP